MRAVVLGRSGMAADSCACHVVAHWPPSEAHGLYSGVIMVGAESGATVLLRVPASTSLVAVAGRTPRRSGARWPAKLWLG